MDPSGTVRVLAFPRFGPLALGTGATLIGPDGVGFGGVSAGYRPGGTGATLNANFGVRGGYGAQIAPPCETSE
jgi:hypothetical protein